MNIFTQNPGGFARPSIFLQQTLGQPINITSKKADTTPQVGGSKLYGESRPGFQGEKHVYMKTDAGLLVRANFAGPGTNVAARLARGDLPINEVDRISKAHDLRYALATDYNQVRAADQKMVSALNSVKNVDMSVRAAKTAMRAKMGLENARVVRRGFFAQHGSETNPQAIAMLQKELAPLAQEGLGSLFPGSAGTDKYHSGVVGGPVKKGSQAAKDKMAKLRGMKRKGKGLRMAGDGYQRIGNGFTKSKKIRAMEKCITHNQTGGFVFSVASMLLPTLAGLALKALAAHGAKKGATALYNKLKGKGLSMAGSGIMKDKFGAFRQMFESQVASPLKAKALQILKSIEEDPAGNIDRGVKLLTPILMEMASAMAGQEGSGIAEDESFIAYAVKNLGKHVADQIKIALGMKKGPKITGTTIPYKNPANINFQKGSGFLSNIKDKATKIYHDVDTLIDKAPLGEAVEIRRILSEIRQDPTRIERPTYLKSVAERLSPTGKRALNTLLKKAKIPVVIS